MSSSSKNKLVEEIKKDLFSGDDVVVMKAVLKCKDQDSVTLVEPLIAVYASTGMPEIRREVADLLNNIKVPNAEQAFLKALANKQNAKVRKDILSFIWNSGIQPTEHIVDLTEIAIDGSFEEALECLTIIENIDDQVPEEKILESVSVLRSAISSQPNDPKTGLLADLLSVLESRTEEF
ncbi:MAG: hypothetical protein RL204_2459 [Bacteroidota bacterium]|jgi:hypothetical protein